MAKCDLIIKFDSVDELEEYVGKRTGVTETYTAGTLPDKPGTHIIDEHTELAAEIEQEIDEKLQQAKAATEAIDDPLADLEAEPAKDDRPIEEIVKEVTRQLCNAGKQAEVAAIFAEFNAKQRSELKKKDLPAVLEKCNAIQTQ